MRYVFLVFLIAWGNAVAWAEGENIEEHPVQLTQTLTTGGIPSDKAMSALSKELLDAAGGGKMVARADTPETIKGKQKFDYWCSTCHAGGLFERGLLPGTVSLAIKYNGEKPAALEARDDLQREYIKYVIRNGSEGMPFFRKTEVSDVDMLAIAAYLSPDEAPVATLVTSNTEGAALYGKYCVACHSADLSGGIGASLISEKMLHGSSAAGVKASISGGYLDKGMPMFSSVLSASQIQSLVDYIIEQRKKKLKNH